MAEAQRHAKTTRSARRGAARCRRAIGRGPPSGGRRLAGAPARDGVATCAAALAAHVCAACGVPRRAAWNSGAPDRPIRRALGPRVTGTRRAQWAAITVYGQSPDGPRTIHGTYFDSADSPWAVCGQCIQSEDACRQSTERRSADRPRPGVQDSSLRTVHVRLRGAPCVLLRLQISRLQVGRFRSRLVQGDEPVPPWRPATEAPALSGTQRSDSNVSRLPRRRPPPVARAI